MNLYLNGKKLKLSPTQVIGKGGEADIFALDRSQAVKVFKQPNHPDYQDIPIAQQAASDRLQEHQTKLRQFPHHLPSRVIKPEAFVTDRQGKTILGYTMPLLTGTKPLLSYSERTFRTNNGINNQTVVEIFRDLHQTLSQIHAAQVIVGDFNDLNVLVSGNKAYLIDADSFQYGQYLCRLFTNRFVDPLLCDPQGDRPILEREHNSNSDWYAFSVMLMQCFLFVEPYGGVYKPKNPKDNIPHALRSLKRITVFHPEVRYPKPAIPYRVLPDDLLQHFYRCFEADNRGKFPYSLLDNLHWKKCSTCGIEYACLTCPNCTRSIPYLKQKQTVTVRGNVSVTSIFQTQGIILTVTLEGETLRWLYHEEGAFKREDRRIILMGNLDSHLSFWLQGRSTLVGKRDEIINLKEDGTIWRLAVDNYRGKPMLQCDRSTRHWLHDGQLFRDGRLGREYIGNVLLGQTQFWLGSHFGFGFYRALNLTVAFVFDIQRSGINDRIQLPHWQGELIDATCTFSQSYCWFFMAIQESGKILHRVYLIKADGTIIATAEAERGENTWLANLRGKYACGNFLLAATDEGIVRLELQNGRIVKTKEFPDTEPFVSANSQLFAAPGGLYVVDRHQITLLQIQSIN